MLLASATSQMRVRSWISRSWMGGLACRMALVTSSLTISSVTKTASSTRWAASCSPRWRSIMTDESTSAVGLMTFLPAYFGADPWTASKIATSSP